MKSLEIVNEMLNYPFEERILTELATNETIIREDELETIKQDLEILEILIKYQKDIRVKPRLSNLKDLHRLKQWLEENENEICN